jgi:opacity protein-like surface antigen
MSTAYVYNRNYGNWNPFVEGGIGVYIFSPIKGTGTTVLDTSQNTSPGGVYGGGLAYQISPSFDIRAEYRGQLLKVPAFNIPGAKTGVYKNISDPVIGIAYHF